MHSWTDNKPETAPVAVSQQLHPAGSAGSMNLLRYRCEEAQAARVSFLELPANLAWADYVPGAVEGKRRLRRSTGSAANLFRSRQPPRKCLCGSVQICARRCSSFRIRAVPSAGRAIESMCCAFRNSSRSRPFRISYVPFRLRTRFLSMLLPLPVAETRPCH